MSLIHIIPIRWNFKAKLIQFPTPCNCGANIRQLSVLPRHFIYDAETEMPHVYVNLKVSMTKNMWYFQYINFGYFYIQNNYKNESYITLSSHFGYLCLLFYIQAWINILLYISKCSPEQKLSQTMSTKFEINTLCSLFIYTITFCKNLKKHVEIIIRLEEINQAL
jgi:hypothetical protein